MAHNFRISIHQKIDNMHIRLMGDFDGSSAFELLNTLKENSNSSKGILFDTYSLKEVYPFGREVFYRNFSRIRNQRMPIRIVGPDVLQIPPT